MLSEVSQMENVPMLLVAVFIMMTVLVVFSLTIYFVLEGLFSFRKRRVADSRDAEVEATYEKALL